MIFCTVIFLTENCQNYASRPFFYTLNINTYKFCVKIRAQAIISKSSWRIRLRGDVRPNHNYYYDISKTLILDAWIILFRSLHLRTNFETKLLMQKVSRHDVTFTGEVLFYFTVHLSAWIILPENTFLPLHWILY